jgi:putative SOS response-associated peptidase YedK
LGEDQPLIVPVADHARWLDSSRMDLVELLVRSANGLVTYPVSTVVNSLTNDDARCTEPVAEGADPKGSLSLF